MDFPLIVVVCRSIGLHQTSRRRVTGVSAVGPAGRTRTGSSAARDTAQRRSSSSDSEVRLR